VFCDLIVTGRAAGSARAFELFTRREGTTLKSVPETTVFDAQYGRTGQQSSRRHNSSTFRRAAGGRFGAERIRLMIMDEGPVRLSRLSNAQAVGRDTPRAAACLAVVSYPAATNASRISASFEACRAFEAKYNASKLFWLLPRPIVVPGRSKSRLRVQIKAAGRIESVP